MHLRKSRTASLVFPAQLHRHVILSGESLSLKQSSQPGRSLSHGEHRLLAPCTVGVTLRRDL
jgi:hypothetical protein